MIDDGAMEPKANIFEHLRSSIFASNEDFIEYKRQNVITQECAGVLSCSNQRSWSTYEYLLLQWNEAVHHLSCKSMQENSEEFFKDWFQRLWALHTSYSTRHYHTVVHLEEMLYYMTFVFATASEQEQSGKETGCIKSNLSLAIFFHDVVYDPKSNKNEEDSANLFEAFAEGTNMSPNQKQDIVSYILATKHHTVDDDDIGSTKQGAIFDNPLLLFLDFDMAVLGKDERAYQHYAALIRREYEFVPLGIYCEKRANILETFLQQKQIFYTSVFYDAFESRARLNLRKEIEYLREGKLPFL